LGIWVLARVVSQMAGRMVSGGIWSMNPTAREVQIVEMLSRGLCLKQVAYELGIAEKTARAHVYNVHNKVRAGNQSHCFRLLVERGHIPIRSSPVPIDRLNRIISESITEVGKRVIAEWEREAA
jgi:DNA-binding CsgD family transcriptional regulator